VRFLTGSDEGPIIALMNTVKKYQLSLKAGNLCSG
jgi:hypothetical protein